MKSKMKELMDKMREVRINEGKVERILNYWIFENLKMANGERLELTSYQRDIAKDVLLRAFGLKSGSGKYCIVSATRVGKTEFVSVVALLLALLKKGIEILVVAPIYRQAIEGIYDRIEGYLWRNKRLWKMVRRVQRNIGRIELKNGSKILCLSANNTEGLLGFGGQVVIVDEAGSIDKEVLRQKVLRMIMNKKDGGNLLFVIGTPHNKDSYLYDAWVGKNFEKYRITWKEAVNEGIMDEREIDFIRKELSEDEFAVWYEAEWRDLSEDDFFDMERVREKCVIEKKSYDKKSLERFDEIILGCDVARYGTSKSAIVILGRLGENVYMIDYRTVSKKGLSWQMGWIESTAKKFRANKVVVDSTGLGSGVHDVLKEKLEGKGIEVVGFNFGRKKERFRLYDRLKWEIEEGNLYLLKDEKLRGQFNAFKVKYRADGSKDVIKLRNVENDIIDALALSLHGFGGGEVFGVLDIDVDHLMSVRV